MWTELSTRAVLKSGRLTGDGMGTQVSATGGSYSNLDAGSYDGGLGHCGGGADKIC